MSFSIVSSDSGVVRLHLEGELDHGATYVLRLELAALLRRRPSRVELSLSPVMRFDETARGLLLSFFDLLQARGGRLALCGPSGFAVIEPCQMDRLRKALLVRRR